MWAIVFALCAAGQGPVVARPSGEAPKPGVLLEIVPDWVVVGQNHGRCDPPPQGFLQRMHPVGGWHPDAGGLIHWWPRGCFPCSSATDDYCRKKLPQVCWPAYPPFYKWAAPE